MDPFATVTGVGYAELNLFVVPQDASSCISPEESNHEVERYWDEPLSTIAVFHDSCWNMLLDYVSLKTTIVYEKNDIAQCLYDIVYDLPSSEDCSVIIGQQVRQRSGRGNSVLPARYKYAEANPDILPITHAKATKPFETDTRPLPFDADANSFSKLPLEIMHHLVSFMDSPTLCNFRLSSKVIASLAHTDNLPQAFWASRFAADHEMGFFPLNWESSDGPKDWRRLYFYLRDNLKNRSRTGHMRSRRRIWSCIKRLRFLIKMMIQHTPDFQDNGSLLKDIDVQGLHITDMIKGLTTLNPLRKKGSQFLVIDPKQAKTDGLRMSISTITLQSVSYICGLRISTGDDKFTGDEISRVGFVLPSTETHLCISKSARLVAIRVAVSIGGIIGIELEEEDAMGQVMWQSMGQLRDLPDFSGIVTLKPKNESQISGLILGFDSYKAISIQLVERANHWGQKSSPRLKSWVWHSVEPSSHTLIMPPDMERVFINDQPTVAFNMDFGGPDGTWLPLLVHISVLTFEQTDGLRGFAFYYKDGSCKRYLFQTKRRYLANRRLNVCERGLPLNGPGGERIIAVMLENWGNQFQLKIMTNLRRVSQTRLVDGEREDIMQDSTHNQLTQSIGVPDGQTIIKILTSVQLFLGNGKIETLGINCTQIQGHLSTATPLLKVVGRKEGLLARSSLQLKAISLIFLGLSLFLVILKLSK
ncbi:hypothetical protein FPOAC2_05295 [Fusarium poae]